MNVLGGDVFQLLLHVNDQRLENYLLVLNSAEEVALVLLAQSMGNLSTFIQQPLAALDHVIDHIGVRVLLGCRENQKFN